MKHLMIYLLLAYSSVLAYNDSLVFSFYSLKNMNAPIDYRKNDFSAVFGDSLFDKDGLFVFYEYLGVQRLYVQNDEHRESMTVYQLPETRMLPWLHPEAYMEKRNQLLEQKISIEKCKTEISSEELLVADLNALHIDEHLYVKPKQSYNRNAGHVVMGFSQRGGKRHNFYYVKYDDIWEKMGEHFAVYADVFKVMDKLDKKIAFPECK